MAMRWMGGLALASAGCGIPATAGVVGESGGTTTSDAATTEPDSRGDAGATSTSATTSTPGSTSSGMAESSTADDGTTSGPDIPDSVCDPQPEPVQTLLLIDGTEGFAHPTGEWEHDCTVEAIEAGVIGDSVLITFACDDGEGMALEHSLSISSVPMLELPFAIGQSIVFHLWTFVPSWGNEFLAIRDTEGELLFAFISANAIPTAQTDVDGARDVPPAAFFAPLELAGASPCEADCYVAPANFIMDPCPCDLRLAIDFTVGDETERVLDRGTGVLASAGLSLRVQNATWHLGIEGQDDCGTDDPGGWYRVFVTRTPR